MSAVPKRVRAADRWLLAVALVVLDVVVFVVPVTGLVAAWVILARPAWFRRWVDELYAAPGEGRATE